MVFKGGVLQDGERDTYGTLDADGQVRSLVTGFGWMLTGEQGPFLRELEK